MTDAFGDEKRSWSEMTPDERVAADKARKKARRWFIHTTDSVDSAIWGRPPTHFDFFVAHIRGFFFGLRKRWKQKRGTWP